MHFLFQITGLHFNFSTEYLAQPYLAQPYLQKGVCTITFDDAPWSFTLHVQTQTWWRKLLHLTRAICKLAYQFSLSSASSAVPALYMPGTEKQPNYRQGDREGAGRRLCPSRCTHLGETPCLTGFSGLNLDSGVGITIHFEDNLTYSSPISLQAPPSSIRGKLDLFCLFVCFWAGSRPVT